ncbi:MAG: ankyrin repeat domain-containing protein [Mariniblastus sp.]
MTLTKADHAAFSMAIESGDYHAAESLIGKHPELVSHGSWTPPPIHCAVLWNQPRIAELLLDNGADLEMLDPYRQTTPLRYAIMYGVTDLIPVLLSRGANAGPIIENGATALQLARGAANGAYEEYEDLPSREEYEKVVALLCQYGLTT